MFTKLSSFALLVGFCSVCTTGTAQTVSEVEAPEGFESIFNGESLDGWYASPTADPRKFASLSQAEQSLANHGESKMARSSMRGQAPT